MQNSRDTYFRKEMFFPWLLSYLQVILAASDVTCWKRGVQFVFFFFKSSQTEFFFQNHPNSIFDHTGRNRMALTRLKCYDIHLTNVFCFFSSFFDVVSQLIRGLQFILWEQWATSYKVEKIIVQLRVLLTKRVRGRGRRGGRRRGWVGPSALRPRRFLFSQHVACWGDGGCVTAGIKCSAHPEKKTGKDVENLRSQLLLSER